MRAFAVVLWLLSSASFVGGKAVIEDDAEGSKEDVTEKKESAIDDIIEVNKNLDGDLFEGDIILEDIPEDIRLKYDIHDPSITKRSEGEWKRALRRRTERLWVDRIVPYEIARELEPSRKKIEHAMATISNQSCIRFVPHTFERNWIFFEDQAGCFSDIGRLFWKSGSQTVSLGHGCLIPGTILHEIMHTLGFWHEQSRPDRDQYVKIYWENILEGNENNFNKYSKEEAMSGGSAYDIHSIMHYGRMSFSKNGQPTTLSVFNDSTTLGQLNHLSKDDVFQLNYLYRCNDIGEIYTSWTDWSPCDPDRKCVMFRQRFCSHVNKNECLNMNSAGVETERSQCTEEVCYKPRNGHWNRWSEWTECDASCGEGVKSRVRVCNDPAPRFGGKACVGGRYKENTGCTLKPCWLGKDDCLFDKQGMCFWTIQSNGKYKWARFQGKTPTSRTGPTADHTSGTGNYVYAEASSPARMGMKTRLVSKLLPAVFRRCLRFYYHMNGPGIGALRLYQVESGKSDLLWTLFGKQSDEWLEEKIQITSQLPYKIEFEAERGGNFFGDIALDDITFTEGTCTMGNVLPKSTAPPVTKPTTVPIDPYTTLLTKSTLRYTVNSSVVFSAPSTTTTPVTIIKTHAAMGTKENSLKTAPPTTTSPPQTNTSLPPTTTPPPPTTAPLTTTSPPQTTTSPTTTPPPQTTTSPPPTTTLLPPTTTSQPPTTTSPTQTTTSQPPTTTSLPPTTTTQPPTTTSTKTTDTTVSLTGTKVTTFKTASLERVPSYCQHRVRALGCYVNVPSQPAMKHMLDTHRTVDHALSHNFLISWKKYEASIEELLCHCIARARARNLRYIGLQYFGECWAGDDILFSQYGVSKSCINGVFNSCNHPNSNRVCIGKANANYVYEILF